MPTTLFPQLSTIPAFQQIGYFHLGSVREYEANGRTVMEGEFVDYRPPTPERRPFRFHVAHVTYIWVEALFSI